MTQELKLIKQELRRVKKELENFEKRSKMIKVVRTFEFLNRYSTQINVAKSGKVVNEMIEYVKGFCNYVETEEDGTMWLRNYNDDNLANENTKPEFEICVYFVK